MSKQYNIRWNENDSKELARSVKNFNAKIKRLENKYAGQDVIIPEKVSVKEMKELINTRRDLQRELKSLQRFTERGAEKPVNIPNTDNSIQLTKWQKDEMSRRAGIINRKRTQRRKAIEEKELSYKGQPLGYNRGAVGMGRPDELVLRPTKAFTPKMTKQDVKYKFKHFMRESQSDYWHKRDLAMREGFIKALEQNFNSNDIKDIKEAILDMDINDFKETLLANPEDFSTAYPPGDEEYEGYLNQLRASWMPKNRKRVGK